LVAVRRSRVEQLIAQGNRRAKRLQRAVSNLDAYLAATQLGVTMSSLGLGWLGEPAVAALVEPVFHAFLPESVAEVGAHTFSVVIAFSLITSLHIVLGELAPKSLALQRPEKTALSVVPLLEVYLAIFRPLVRLMNFLGNWVLALIGLEAGSEEMVHSPEEIRLLVAASRKAGLVGEMEEDVVERIFELGERRVSAFMTPRRAIVWLDIAQPLPKLQQQIMSSVHSRFLVCQGSIDQVLGFISAKEFLGASLSNTLTATDLIKHLAPPLYLPESTRAVMALEQFKNTGSYIAVVVDEYGVIQGLVTLNDILEAVVGSIHTGNEPLDPQATQRSDGSWLIDGMLPIETFKEIFDIADLPGEEGVEYLTVGGFVLSQLGYVPRISDTLTWNGLQIEVVALDDHRIDRVLVTGQQTTRL
jgi:CBS domain containing-hemolysin-like protein